ncbi:hypothetical protein ASE61_14890 [Bosea sp. Root670]|nr:hypothetical protein ASE61_14890 [Bosea sp. Root670]
MGASDECRQFPKHVDLRSLARRRRLDRHRPNQVAQGRLGLAAMLLTLCDRHLKPLDRGEVMSHSRGVQCHDLRRLLGCGELGAQPVAFGFKRRQLALKSVFLDQPLHISPIHPLVLALGGCKPSLDLPSVCDRAGGQALPLLVVDTDIEGNGVAIGHALAQASHDGLLDLVEIVAAPVAAAARFGRRSAANPDPAVVAILD